ncbi:unnamed protein product [Lactuca saligna]|uniref:Uncharacterized protein n=1 Tax=Lactuca saligna TaxID=75948 RepID=A0AA36E497_LACSI|nr:unnamed protein product [Lactuca saligna]
MQYNILSNWDTKKEWKKDWDWDAHMDSHACHGRLCFGMQVYLLGMGRQMVEKHLQQSSLPLLEASFSKGKAVGYKLLEIFKQKPTIVQDPTDGKCLTESLISTQSRLVISPSETDASTDSILTSDSICIKVPTDDIRVGDFVLVLPGDTIPIYDDPLKIEASSTGSNSTITKIVKMVEDAKGREAPIQRLAYSIVGTYVYTVMTLSTTTFSF